MVWSRPLNRNLHSRLDEFLTRPKKAIWVIAGPTIFGFAVHALYAVVDTAFIGRIGPDALAAATFVLPFLFVAIALINGLVIGVTATIAQAIGRRDTEAADRLASISLGLALGLGLALAAAGLVIAPYLMPVLGAEGSVVELAMQYFRLTSLGMPLFFFGGVIRAVLTGEGDAKTPTIVMSASTIINLGLDPIFIFVFDWGIRGAALATIVASLFSCAAYVYIAFVKRRLTVRFRLRLIAPRWSPIAQISAIGVPAAANQVVIALGMGLTNRVLAEFGQTAVAGYGAGSKIDMIIILPVLGLASAAVTVIGMFAGAGRPDLIRTITVYTCRWAISIAAALGIAAYLAAEPAIGLFTDDPGAIAVGCTYITYIVFVYPLAAFGITSGRILQGLGYGLPSLAISLLRVLAVAIPASYLAVYVFDAPIHAVWISFIVAGMMSNLLAVWWLRRHIWQGDPSTRARQNG